MQGNKYKILAISGSIRENSSNGSIIKMLTETYKTQLDIQTLSIAELPHFVPNTAENEMPLVVKNYLEAIEKADGVLFCTPEYVFSPPALLKNALEWTVSTVVFSEKPIALIVAAANGEKTLESMSLILQTIGAKFNAETTILIRGIKGKFDEQGQMNDTDTLHAIDKLMQSFIQTIKN